MDVRGILLVTPGDSSGAVEFAGCPLPTLDVLGKSVLERAAEAMLACGFESVTILCHGHVLDQPWFRRRPDGPDSPVSWVRISGEELWRKAEGAFNDLVRAGAELIVLQRMDLYAEVSYRNLLQFHLLKHARVTSVCDDSGALGIFCVSASRRNDAAKIFRNRLEQIPVDYAEYRFNGYLNRLRNAKDLRDLSRDALLFRNRIIPEGREIRPGVWAGSGARIERGARIVAPAYIGAHAKIRTRTVITRGSVVERYAQVDCGTVVEDSSVLPFCYVGAGLELAHSVAGFHRLAHLRRQVEIEVPDSRLLGMHVQRPAYRAANALLSLTTFLPSALARGILRTGSKPLPQPAAEPSFASTLSSWGQSGPAAARNPQPDSPEYPEQANPDLIAVRRYGDQ